jgi:Type I phosphodiesterase / nucleotide pyrophosphatase
MVATVIGGTTFDGVFVLLADGARPDVIERLVSAGEMPWFKRHFLDAGGLGRATSVFPTVTGPAHLPVLTGLHPGRANVPGIRWAERPVAGRRGFLGRTRSYMTPFRQWKLERDLAPSITSLFSHVPGMADVNTMFVRGCPGRARLTRFSKAAAFVRSLVTRDWYASDRQAEGAVRRAFERGFPSAFAVFPAIDEIGHRFGPLCDQSYEAYRRLDAALGRLLDQLTRLGRVDRTLVMVTSDHGQTATHTHVDVDDLVAAIYPRTLSYPRLWRHLFSADAATMVSGNAMANVYVRGSGKAGWGARPDFEAEGQASDLCAALLSQPAVAHVIFRRPAGGYVVAGQRGRVIIEEDAGVARAEKVAASRLRLRVEGESPLGALPPGGTRAELLAATTGGPFPDAPWQVVQFFRASRAGDLVVCARPGYDLRSRFEYQPHHGSHGCLDRDHMLIPVAVNASWSRVPIRSVDLFPTILAALGRPVPEGLDGEAVPLARA